MFEDNWNVSHFGDSIERSRKLNKHVSTNREIFVCLAKFPLLWSSCPKIKFIYAEAHSSSKCVGQDIALFKLVLTTFLHEKILSVMDFIRDPPTVND